MQFARKALTASVFATLICGALAAGRPVMAAERSLAGIKIFGPALAIVRKFGTPAEVRQGDISTVSMTVSTQGGQTSLNFPSTSDAGGQQYQPPGMQSANSQDDGSLNSSAQSSSASSAPGLVTWVYYQPNGNMLEFVITQSDGRVVRIHVTGYKSAFRTSRGIGLGQTYRQVVEKYGFPENHDIGTPAMLTAPQSTIATGQSPSSSQGGMLSPGSPASPGQGNSSSSATTQDLSIVEAKYTEHQHVTFQFYRQRVVGILVGVVD